jgi:hypothetical protein
MFVRRTNTGFHKHDVRQYKNILIFCSDCPDPRAKQGPALYFQGVAALF